MNAATIQADRLSEQSSAFAVALWEALSHLPLMSRRETFESAVQLISDGVAGREATNLVEAYAMLAAIDQFPNRKLTIENEAQVAYADYVRLLNEEQLNDAADYYADMACDSARQSAGDEMSETQIQHRSDELGSEAADLLQRLFRYGYLCWNGHKMEGAAHDLIMLGYAEGRRPPRHRNWYIDITPEGRQYAERTASSTQAQTASEQSK